MESMNSYTHNHASLERTLGMLQQPRVARALSLTLTLLFTAGCLAIAYDLKITFWDKQSDQSSVSETTTVQRTTTSKNLTARNINQWHLFGQAQNQNTESAPAPITAPETRLNLKLNGIIASDGENTAGAIIEKSPGNQEYFALGDTISNGVTLKEVYTDRVILSRSGRLETLSLPKLDINASSTGFDSTPVVQKPAVSRPANVVPDNVKPISANTPKPTVGRDAKDTKKLLEKYREMVLQRQQRLMKEKSENNNEE